MLRIPHYLENRLKDGGKVVSFTHPPHFTPQKHYYFNLSGTHFCSAMLFIPSFLRVKEKFKAAVIEI
jgi:hypothetical protein